MSIHGISVSVKFLKEHATKSDFRKELILFVLFTRRPQLCCILCPDDREATSQTVKYMSIQLLKR